MKCTIRYFLSCAPTCRRCLQAEGDPVTLPNGLRIRDCWYAVLDSDEISAKMPRTFRRLGEDILFFRDQAGYVAALADRCPHRGVSLGGGRIVDGCVQCPFHGMEFDRDGVCRHIPAHGRRGDIPATLRAKRYEVREDFGFIWLWDGEPRQEYPPLPYFEELLGFSYSTSRVAWKVDHSRAIEGALDLAHLPFVHARTIGASREAFVRGPATTLERDTLRVWIDNKRDTGERGPVPIFSIPPNHPLITFKFPNTWQLYLMPKLRNVIVMAPVDEENTVLYVRTYQSFTSLPFIGTALAWLFNRFNLMVAAEDYRVLRTVKPLMAEVGPSDHLIPADRPIALYLQHRRALIEGRRAPGQSLRVRSVIHETDDAISVVLESASSPLLFEPGQFFTVVVEVGGQTHRRAYSASSAPGEHGGGVRLTIKRVSGGVVSNYLVENTRVGDEWNILGPSGTFVPGMATGPRLLVLLAGGSGVTPMLSMVRTLLAREPNTHIVLVLGSRTQADILFHDELQALVQVHKGRLVLRMYIDEHTSNWNGGVGRLTADVLEAVLRTLEDAEAYFVCGPSPMMEAARSALRALRVDDSRVRFEAFNRSEARMADRPVDEQATEVTIVGPQGARTFNQDAGDTILEAATKVGVTLPFSCTIGACGSCRVTVVDGEVRMHEPNCLTPDERARGLVLTCVGTAIGRTRISQLGADSVSSEGSVTIG